MYTKSLVVVAVLAAIILAGCGKQSESTDTLSSQNETSMVQCADAVKAYLDAADKNGQGNTVANGNSIVVDYIGRLDDGSVFDTSVESVARACGVYTEGRDYAAGLPFTVGAGQMIAGFDKGVEGMKVNQTKTITIDAKDAYGEWSDQNLVSVEKATVPNADDYEKGQVVVGQYGQQFKIYDIQDDVIVFDANHPLAGKDLIFDITIKEVK